MSAENPSYYLDFNHHKVSDILFTETWESKLVNKIIVSVPHDVRANYTWPDQLRTQGVIHGDLGVWLVAKDLMFEQPMQIRLDIQDRISVVRTTMPRGLVDMNRRLSVESNYSNSEVQTALENLRYTNVYKHYYLELSRLIELGIKTFGTDGLLVLDLHGFKKQPEYAPDGGFDLIFGTDNRKTIFNNDVDIKMGQYLQELGYKVFVPNNNPINGRKEDAYAAGYITRSFSDFYNINVIQIEIAYKFRDKVGGLEIGPKLSRDLLGFLNTF